MSFCQCVGLAYAQADSKNSSSKKRRIIRQAQFVVDHSSTTADTAHYQHHFSQTPTPFFHYDDHRVPPLIGLSTSICQHKNPAADAHHSAASDGAAASARFGTFEAAQSATAILAPSTSNESGTESKRLHFMPAATAAPSSPVLVPLSSSKCWRRNADIGQMLRLLFLLLMWTSSLLHLPMPVHSQNTEDFLLHPAPRQTRRVYTNQWAVRIDGGWPAQADAIASKYGFRNLGPIISGGDYFLFESHVVKKRSLRKVRRHLHHPTIGRELNVLWLEQQVVKKRVKRDFRPIRRQRSVDQQLRPPLPLTASTTAGDAGDGGGTTSVAQLLRPRARHHQQQQQHRTALQPFRPPVIQNSDDYESSDYYGANGPDDFQNMNRISHNDQHRAQWARLRYGVPNDPYWKDMWYLHRRDEQPDEMDHNVKEAWYLGYTGKGIVVTILDDGLERTHPDIGPNYDPDASYDVNDRDEDPTPRYEYTDENRHGTRCAGEVASIFNNSLCIVGIAFNARIGGIRMLDGDVTDAVEATSLSHNSQHIDIYSASWGPDDDGRTVDGPATLTRSAFERGITEGRQGKGSIFIWASGNGGKDADSCNCDGYTNSIHTLSISSATERGAIPWYSEACSSTLATAYSSGSSGERMIVTTDLHHSCTKSHTGTSASAPLAAGIGALTLEANPNLGWRDMQHIVVRTAKPVNLRAGDWRLNGVGRNVSHSFGYGLLDAGAMVRLAKVWHNVPKQRKCRATYPNPYKTIPHGNRLHLQVYTDGCADKREQQVKYLEHVQAIVTLSAPKRGDIQIYLTSPRGTRSTLLAKRQRDTSRTGFKEWAFMSTHNWGESAYGTWSLEIDNDGNDDAELLKWELVLHGTDMYIGPTGHEPASAVAERSVQQQQPPNGVADTGGEHGVPPMPSSLFGSDIINENSSSVRSIATTSPLLTLALLVIGTLIFHLLR
uniref:P/Homo B domain-containing protein n=1 Tax=Globodera pallida TaxID=36090 RepID=A0A183BVH1_GLOPA